MLLHALRKLRASALDKLLHDATRLARILVPVQNLLLRHKFNEVRSRVVNKDEELVCRPDLVRQFDRVSLQFKEVAIRRYEHVRVTGDRCRVDVDVIRVNPRKVVPNWKIFDQFVEIADKGITDPGDLAAIPGWVLSTKPVDGFCKHVLGGYRNEHRVLALKLNEKQPVAECSREEDVRVYEKPLSHQITLQKRLLLAKLIRDASQLLESRHSLLEQLGAKI